MNFVNRFILSYVSACRIDFPIFILLNHNKHGNTTKLPVRFPLFTWHSADKTFNLIERTSF